jgi:quercetin dioxygenase-like cupin family protein
VSDTGDKPFRNRTIEIMQPTTNQKACTESCAVPVPCDAADKTACPSVVKLFTADQWTVTLVTLPPGARYPQHSHPGNYLNVPLADADVTVKKQDQPETVGHYKTGEVTWNSPVVHAATNNGKTAARLVVLEFKPQDHP